MASSNSSSKKNKDLSKHLTRTLSSKGILPQSGTKQLKRRVGHGHSQSKPGSTRASSTSSYRNHAEPTIVSLKNGNKSKHYYGKDNDSSTLRMRPVSESTDDLLDDYSVIAPPKRSASNNENKNDESSQSTQYTQLRGGAYSSPQTKNTKKNALHRLQTSPIQHKTESNRNIEQSQFDHPHNIHVLNNSNNNSSNNSDSNDNTSVSNTMNTMNTMHNHNNNNGMNTSSYGNSRFQHTHSYTGSRRFNNNNNNSNNNNNNDDKGKGSLRSQTLLNSSNNSPNKPRHHRRHRRHRIHHELAESGSNLMNNKNGSGNINTVTVPKQRHSVHHTRGASRSSNGDREMSKSRSHSRSGMGMTLDDLSLQSMPRARNSRTNLGIDDSQLSVKNSVSNQNINNLNINMSAQTLRMNNSSNNNNHQGELLHQPTPTRFNLEHFNAEDDDVDDDDDSGNESGNEMDDDVFDNESGDIDDIKNDENKDTFDENAVITIAQANKKAMKEINDSVRRKAGYSMGHHLDYHGRNNDSDILSSSSNNIDVNNNNDNNIDNAGMASSDGNVIDAKMYKQLSEDSGKKIMGYHSNGHNNTSEYDSKMTEIDDRMEYDYSEEMILDTSMLNRSNNNSNNGIGAHSDKEGNQSDHSVQSAHSTQSHNGVSHQRLKKFGNKFKGFRSRDQRSQTTTTLVNHNSNTNTVSNTTIGNNVGIIDVNTPSIDDDNGEIKPPMTNRSKSYHQTNGNNISDAAKRSTLSPDSLDSGNGGKRSSFVETWRKIKTVGRVLQKRRGSQQAPMSDTMRTNENGDVLPETQNHNSNSNVDVMANENQNFSNMANMVTTSPLAPNAMHGHNNSMTNSSFFNQGQAKSAHAIPDSTTNIANLTEPAKDDDDPMRLNASVVGVRRLADHAEYEIEVSIDDHRWCIYRRFNEFREFDKNLRKLFKSEIQKLPEFPKRTVIPTMSEDLLLKRKSAFNDYVTQLLNNPILSHCNLVLVFFKMDDSLEFLNNQDDWEERWKKHEIIMWECGETNIPYDRSTVLQLRLSCENVPIRRENSAESGSCLRIYQREKYDDFFNDKRLLMITDYVIDNKNPRYSRICLFPYMPWGEDDTENELIFDLCLNETSDESIGTTRLNFKHLLCQRNGFIRIPIVTENNSALVAHRHSLPSKAFASASDGNLLRANNESLTSICVAVTRYRDRRDKNPYQKLPKHQLPSGMKMKAWNNDINKEFVDMLGMDMVKDGAKFRAKMNHIRKQHLEYDYFVTKSKSESESAGHLMLQLWKMLLNGKFDSSFNRTVYTSIAMIASRYEWDLVHIERWTKLGKNYVPETTTGWEGAMRTYHELCVESIEYCLQMIDTLFDSNETITNVANSLMPESTRNLDYAFLLKDSNNEMKDYFNENKGKKGKKMNDLIEESKYNGELTFIYTIIGIAFLRFSSFRRQCLPLLTDYLTNFLRNSKQKRYEKVSLPWQQSFAQTIADEQQKTEVVDSFFSQFNPSVFSKAWVSYIKKENNERIKIKSDKQTHFMKKHWLPIICKIFELSSKYCHGKMAWQKIDGFSRIEQLFCECISWTQLNTVESNQILKYVSELMYIPQMKHEMGLFSMSLLYNTDCMEPMQVEICFMTLLKWIMDSVTQWGDRQLPDTFCHVTFETAIDRILKQNDYQVICSGLSFVLQHSHLFCEKFRKRILLDLLLKEHFNKLFCHWSHNVRKYFHMVLLYCMNRVGYFNEEHRKKYIETNSLDREIIDQGHLLYVQFDLMTKIGPFQGKYKKKDDDNAISKLNIKPEKLKNVTYDPIDFDSDSDFSFENKQDKKEILQTRITDMTVKDRFDTDAAFAEQLNLVLSQLHQNGDKMDNIYKQYIALSFREFAYQCQEYRRIQTKNSQNWKFGHVYVPTLIYHVRNKSVETEFAKKQSSKDQEFIQ